MSSFESLIEIDLRDRRRDAGADLVVKGILEDRCVLAFGWESKDFNTIAYGQRSSLFALNEQSAVQVLNKQAGSQTLVNDRAGDLDAMAICALWSKLQQAANGLSWNGKRICRRWFL